MTDQREDGNIRDKPAAQCDNQSKFQSKVVRQTAAAWSYSYNSQEVVDTNGDNTEDREEQ